jgi:hypothetical protein
MRWGSLRNLFLSWSTDYYAFHKTQSFIAFVPKARMETFQINEDKMDNKRRKSEGND